MALMQPLQLGHESITHSPRVLARPLVREPFEQPPGQPQDGVSEATLVGADEVGVQRGQLVEAPQGRVLHVRGEVGRLDEGTKRGKLGGGGW